MDTFIKESVRWLLSRTQIGKKLILGNCWWPCLEKIGWIRSYDEGLPVDHNGNCLPWLTYPMISFLKGKIRSDMIVFEYGSGNSTLWWSKQVLSLISCEHSHEWYNSIKEKIPSNVKYIYCEFEYGGQYCKTILEYKDRFDIVVIDGMDRVNCSRNSLGALNDDGVIIWDNSDKERYQEGYSYLIKQGFRRLDFEGFVPGSNNISCTSIFYRDNNCLCI